MNKETCGNAAVFAQNVYESLQAEIETCASYIDLEDAYNREVFGFLPDQLLELMVPPYILNWILAALLQRKVLLKCGSWVSDPVTICPGFPQGSPLTPVLINTYTIRITRKQIIGYGKTQSYADNILVYWQGKDRESLTA